MRAIKQLTIIMVLLIIGISFIPTVSAHRCFVEPLSDGDIVVKAYYEGDTPMGYAEYQIFNTANDEILYEGEADENGILSFSPVEGVEEYKVVVDQFGHQGEAIVTSTGESTENAELPLFMRIFAGFGYLLGFAGIAMIYTAKKHQK